MIDGALLESPVSHTHTHAAACTDERAATYTSENELWVKIGRVRKSTFHFQRTSSCATSRGHLRPPLSPSFVLFPPPSAPPCSRSLRRLCFRMPPPLAAAPATGGLCMLWHRRNSTVFQRPTTAPALFNARRISRNCATRSLSRASAPCLSFHSRASFETKRRVSRGLRGANFVSNLFTRSRRPVPGVVFRSSFVAGFHVLASLQPPKGRTSADQRQIASPKEIVQARCEPQEASEYDRRR